MKKIMSHFLIAGALGLIPLSYAQALITQYKAVIGPQDRVNSNGQKLTKVNQVLRQNRFDFYNGTASNGNFPDGYFNTLAHRTLFDGANIQITPNLAQQIVNGQGYVPIHVLVQSPQSIKVW